jgi:hypothetical protein
VYGILFCTILRAQTLADFENLFPGPDQFNLGENVSGSFESGNVILPNVYNEQFMSFSGWAISSTTDTSTPGFTNQSSAIVGHGNLDSDTYAFSYAFDPVRMYLKDDAIGGMVDGIYVTNSTYAYLSMLNGDMFSKKFGGIDGSDPDFFVLIIKAYKNGRIKNDVIEFYLADYRFEDPQLDYIVNSWTWVDLKDLGNIDSLEFSLQSSDTGDFGMNTPAYFCVDDVRTLDFISNQSENNQMDFHVYPNPGNSTVQINHFDDRIVDLIVYDVYGMIKLEKQNFNSRDIDLHTLEDGLYFFHIRDQKGQWFTAKWIKKSE